MNLECEEKHIESSQLITYYQIINIMIKVSKTNIKA